MKKLARKKKENSRYARNSNLYNDAEKKKKKVVGSYIIESIIDFRSTLSKKHLKQTVVAEVVIVIKIMVHANSYKKYVVKKAERRRRMGKKLKN